MYGLDDMQFYCLFVSLNRMKQNDDAMLLITLGSVSHKEKYFSRDYIFARA